ncbi:MAG: PhzF family phenazine biosynthesis protein [Ktedonobacterales bacterium]|nr:PhzF family phenazine biosynthesis protein [Ktedonobacterales bacterium]
MGQRITQVDAFTDRPFAGNPAGVCLLTEPREDGWMRQVAAEMNLAETAFLRRAEDEEGGYSLRWFTPTVEVDLCGHATLASAHVLWEEGHLAPEARARFHTRGGLLTAERQGEWIQLDFPLIRPEPAETPAALIQALGVTPRYVGKRDCYLVEVESAETVRAIQPDFALLMTVPTTGVIVTSRDTSGTYDFISRFFAPHVGINEDPVTGSAHCYLAPYWGERLGKTELVGYQASRRGGVVRVRVAGDRVWLGGQAVTTLRGELAV